LIRRVTNLRADRLICCLILTRTEPDGPLDAARSQDPAGYDVDEPASSPDHPALFEHGGLVLGSPNGVISRRGSISGAKAAAVAPWTPAFALIFPHKCLWAQRVFARNHLAPLAGRGRQQRVCADAG
jgi:hypothetical protein